jgi:hypothetical protein
MEVNPALEVASEEDEEYTQQDESDEEPAAETSELTDDFDAEPIEEEVIDKNEDVDMTEYLRRV